MNLIQITNNFPTELSAINYFERVRWGNKVKCPYCGSEKHSKRNKDFRYHCKECDKTYSVTVNTNIHNTRLPLKTWLYAIALITDAKKGMSAKQLERNLGIHYETAWRMYHKLRELMTIENESLKLKGVVEMDETFLGGKPRKNAKMLLSETEKENLDLKLYDLREDFGTSKAAYKKNYPLVKPKRGRGADRPIVAGIVQRDGNVIAEVMSRLTHEELKKLVKKHVDREKSILVTDEYRGYQKMNRIIEHVKIDHQKMWSYKGINTNSIEGFWSIIKRGLVGQYHHVSLEYLPKYVAEFVFKYNNRNKDDMFITLVRNCMLPINR